MIDAVLFDLDETMTDRSASLAKYAALFHRTFAEFLGPTPVENIEATFLALDKRGYRPREEVYAGPQIFRCALEQMGCVAGDTMFVGDHPINDVLGAAKSGLVPVWFEGVHAWPQSHPNAERRIRALPEVLQFVRSSNCNAA